MKRARLKTIRLSDKAILPLGKLYSIFCQISEVSTTTRFVEPRKEKGLIIFNWFESVSCIKKFLGQKNES